MSDKKSLRDKIFSKDKKFKTEKVDFFGEEVEIRQPNVGQVLQARDAKDQKEALVNIMVEYCYVPDTDERVFEKTDAAAIMEWPVGKWFTDFNDAVVKLTDIDVAGAEKN